MKNFFRQLINIGVTDSLGFHDQRKARTLNIFNLIVIFFLVLGSTNAVFLKSDYPLLPELCFLALAFGSLYLNYLHKYNWSVLVFTIYINMSLFFVNEYYPFDAGAYLFYFPLTVTIVLLNNPSVKDIFTIIHFVISLVFFVVSLLFDFPQILNNTIAPDVLLVLWYYDVIFSIICTAVLAFMLNRLIYTQNSEILSHLDIEKAAQVKLNQSLKEKEILFAEVHHRVKNNMAIITGLLNLQASSTNNEEAKSLINESKNRVHSMSLVHTMLYSTTDLNKIKLDKYASSLCKELLKSLDSTGRIKLIEQYNDVEVSINKAIPIGLILNEAVTNSIKHAFSTNHPNPEITVNVSPQGKTVYIVVSDNGKGFEEKVQSNQKEKTLGISLIHSLTEQIDGQVEFLNEGGSQIKIKFTIEENT
jgi:two-component sensor histidine kinase